MKGKHIEGLGRRMRIARERSGASQRDVERATGIVQPMITRYERETTEPSLCTLRILAEFYDTSADWLLGLAEPAEHDAFEEALENLPTEARGLVVALVLELGGQGGEEKGEAAA